MKKNVKFLFLANVMMMGANSTLDSVLLGDVVSLVGLNMGSSTGLDSIVSSDIPTETLRYNHSTQHLEYYNPKEDNKWEKLYFIDGYNKIAGIGTHMLLAQNVIKTKFFNYSNLGRGKFIDIPQKNLNNIGEVIELSADALQHIPGSVSFNSHSYAIEVRLDGEKYSIPLDSSKKSMIAHKYITSNGFNEENAYEITNINSKEFFIKGVKQGIKWTDVKIADDDGMAYILFEVDGVLHGSALGFAVYSNNGVTAVTTGWEMMNLPSYKNGYLYSGPEEIPLIMDFYGQSTQVTFDEHGRIGLPRNKKYSTEENKGYLIKIEHSENNLLFVFQNPDTGEKNVMIVPLDGANNVNTHNIEDIINDALQNSDLGGALERIETLNSDLERLRASNTELEARIAALEWKLDALEENQFTTIDTVG